MILKFIRVTQVGCEYNPFPTEEEPRVFIVKNVVSFKLNKETRELHVQKKQSRDIIPFVSEVEEIKFDSGL